MGAVPVVTSVSVGTGPVAAQAAEYVPAVVVRIVVGYPVIIVWAIAEAHYSAVTVPGPSEREISAVIIPVPVVPEAGVSHPGVMSADAVRRGVRGVDVAVDVNIVVAAADGDPRAFGGALLPRDGS
jgi:hypothetical protein